jgi:hypothetical protein
MGLFRRILGLETKEVKTRRSRQDHTNLTKKKCRNCKENLTEREIMFGSEECSICFFDKQKCKICGRNIDPYVEGYTKCRQCFKNNE